jgi:hypothetical protein
LWKIGAFRPILAHRARYWLLSQQQESTDKMGTSYRLRIGLREIAALQPHTILWDLETRGFCARRQFSDVITYSVYFRTRDGQQRFYKIGRHGVFTPTQARDEAKQVLRNVAVGKDPGAELKALRSAPMVEWLCDEYVSDMQSGKVNGKKISTIKTDISRIETHIKPALGKRKVAGGPVRTMI